MKKDSIVRHLGQIDAAQPTEAQIHTKLRNAILSLDLPPGALISETEIAQAVGVSRTPVRAALASLRREGLVATRPSRGNYVTQLSETALCEAHFIRDALEQALVARLCETGLNAADLQYYADNLQQAEAAIAAGDRQAFYQLDDAFHAHMAQSLGFARLPFEMAKEKALLGRLRMLSFSDEAYQRQLLVDHQQVLDAIAAQDENAARRLMSGHLGRVLSLLDRLKTSHAAYFDPNP